MVSNKRVILGKTVLVLIIVGIISALFFKDFTFATVMPVLTFTESEVIETVAGSGYTINGTTLTIKSPGIYRVTGSCTTDCYISVKKNTTGVTLIFDNLTLSATSTAPFTVKKDAAATVRLIGASTLTDNETDTTLADYEGAAVKVKSNSSLTFAGPGALNAISNFKNGIKGAGLSSITFSGGTYNVTAENNGIAADGVLTFNRGTFNITTGNDGIKAVPDLGDLESAGALYINGGTFSINATNDGIQAAKTLVIANGTFDILAYKGYNSGCPEEASCKGIKGDSDNEGDEPNVLITGGTFTINSSDDAIHSDADITITGGTISINAKEDGVHAERNLVIGTENGYERDPEITVQNGFEGLEGEKVFIYSGRIKITTRDDGINAAGGGDPEGECYDPNFQTYIYGGNIYTNSNDNDGIDSNGDIHLLGGTIIAYSQYLWGTSLNEALDRCGSLIIDGATVFTGGDKGMDPITNINSDQKFLVSTSRYSTNSNVVIKNGNNILFNETIPKSSTYTFFTSPDLTNEYSFGTEQSLDACKSTTWEQTWDQGVVTIPATPTSNGVMTFTSNCLTTERKTILYEPSGATLNIINKTSNKATATIGETSNTGDFSISTDDGILIVESDEACMVITTTDNGITYEKLTAIPTMDDDAYIYNIDPNYDADVYIVLAGDVTMNGVVNSIDSATIDYSLLSTDNVNYHPLSTLEALIADVTYNDRINSIDSAAIDFSLLSISNINFKELDWTK